MMAIRYSHIILDNNVTSHIWVLSLSTNARAEDVEGLFELPVQLERSFPLSSPRLALMGPDLEEDRLSGPLEEDLLATGPRESMSQRRSGPRSCSLSGLRHGCGSTGRRGLGCWRDAQTAALGAWAVQFGQVPLDHGYQILCRVGPRVLADRMPRRIQGSDLGNRKRYQHPSTRLDGNALAHRLRP